ncbi:hypothetical protein BDV23DRAFT_173186 [Aspergillus alliaceus]|uniref:Uncharacterized protein n=1 Tax=Petromyces alliaceus TaxID=209559 RepID=A0A5N7C5B7_PETAA|nr:hypothetical protein BDV23DRAFT_173186 [Aspergillus alliaceus]
MSLSHPANPMPDDAESRAFDIAAEHNRTGDFGLAGMLTLLLEVISLRGGTRSLAKSTGHAPLLLLTVLNVVGVNTTIVAVNGDTSSLATDLTLATWEYGHEYFAFSTYPTSLFAEGHKINHLRVRASDKRPMLTTDLTDEAYGILNRIRSAPNEEWVFLGNMQQTSITLYCISSLQNLSVLPPIRFLTDVRMANAKLLWVFLGDTTDDAVLRVFVQEKLQSLKYSTGTYVPPMAKGLLEIFWPSGETRWKACFNRPYTFVMYMVVDVNKLH